MRKTLDIGAERKKKKVKWEYVCMWHETRTHSLTPLKKQKSEEGRNHKRRVIAHTLDGSKTQRRSGVKEKEKGEIERRRKSNNRKRESEKQNKKRETEESKKVFETTKRKEIIKDTKCK